MFYCCTIAVPLFIHSMLYCSTNRCSSVPQLDVPLFHHDCVSLFHHHMFYCSAIAVPPFILSMLYFSTNRCSSVPPSDVPLFHPRGVLPYMGYIGMCRCEGYGFQSVYSRIRAFGSRIGYHFSGS